MAGKIAQIEGILTPDNMAKQLVMLYDNWYMQRGVKDAEARELRNYLFATDTTKTTNSKLPWKNKTTIPKITQIRDNLHANYMDALFPNDSWLKWEGYSKDAVIKSKRVAIEAYMGNKIRESGFREFVSQALYDYIDNGNAFAEVIWVTEKTKDVEGNDVPVYIGPKAVRVSMFDHVFNPTAMSYKEAPKFTRYLKSLGEIKKDIQSRPDLQFKEDTFNALFEIRGQLSSFKTEDIAKAESMMIDGFGSLQEYYQSGMVELLEFEGDWFNINTGELEENRIITIADRTHILRNIPNPSWLGSANKAHVTWRDRPDNLYGMGPLDNLVGMQYRLDHLENIKADALDMTIHPPKILKGQVEPFEWGPDAVIQLSEDGDFTTLPPESAAFQVNNEIAYLLQLMEEMAGAPKEAMGIRSPGEKTAFEVQSLQNAAGRIFQNKINKFETQFIEPLINMMLETAKRYMDTTDVARVIDDDLGVMDFISITKEDITSRGKLRPIGARHYAARAQLMQNLVGVFNSPVGNIIAPHISAKNMAKMIDEYMGFEQFSFIKDNAAVFEGKETQQLMNQAQSSVEQESITPVEEGLLPEE